MGTKTPSLAALLLVALLALAGCSGTNKAGQNPAGGGQKTAASPSVNPSPPVAPAGWVNSQDGFFQVKLPRDYLDAYETVGGADFPDAQVIISEPTSSAIDGYVSTVVIDKAPVTTDADYVKDNLEHDPNYPQLRNFQVEKPLQIQDLNTLYVSWNYLRKDVDMKAWVCFISGHGHSYAIKQEVPAQEQEQMPAVIPELAKNWVWNPVPAKPGN